MNNLSEIRLSSLKDKINQDVKPAKKATKKKVAKKVTKKKK